MRPDDGALKNQCIALVIDLADLLGVADITCDAINRPVINWDQRYRAAKCRRQVIIGRPGNNCSIGSLSIDLPPLNESGRQS